MTLKATIIPQNLTVDIAPQAVGVGFDNPIARDYIERDPYTGSYTVTPSEEEQTLQTDGLRMTDNIVVGAIPTNYGRIEWSGSIMTIS